MLNPWLALSFKVFHAVETMAPPIATSDGLARTAKKAFWPILEDISMFSLRISDKGMREPHWHPRTAEMGYVLRAAPA